MTANAVEQTRIELGQIANSAERLPSVLGPMRAQEEQMVGGRQRAHGLVFNLDRRRTAPQFFAVERERKVGGTRRQ